MSPCKNLLASFQNFITNDLTSKIPSKTSRNILSSRPMDGLSVQNLVKIGLELTEESAK